jgi:hypothetical protein
MTSHLQPLVGKAIEKAAISWVMDQERRAAAMRDTRFNGARGDWEPRIIEGKASA